MDRPQTIQRFAGPIDDPPQQMVAHYRFTDTPGGDHPGALFEAVYIPRGHKVETLSSEANHFGFDLRTIAVDDIATATDGCAATDGLQGQTHHAGQPTLHHQTATVAESFPVFTESMGPDGLSIELGERWIHGD